jgi:S1-C subfamily serine protease
VGIGFAIPANMARLVAEAGGSGEALVRPWLGAKLQPVDAGIASGLQLTTPSGALVTETAPDGPAQRAGLEPGDVITAMDGVRVDDPAALTFRLATRPTGSEVRLTVSRRGEPVELVLPVEAPPAPEPDQIAEVSGNTRFAGARAQQLTPPLAQELGLPYDAQGVAITAVAAGSPAANMGLAVGDVILALNGVEVTDAETFRELAGQRPRTWEIVMQRNGQVLRTYVSG